MPIGYEVVLKERTVGKRTVLGTDWPISVQLVRTNLRPWSCLPRIRPFYEVRCVFREAIQGQRQFASLRDARKYYATHERP